MKESVPPLPRSYSCRKRFDKIYQFHIALEDIEPIIWRRIQVPERYSFWDLHCSITDAFGWLDYHLHQFTMLHPESKKLDCIGIPDDEGFDDSRILSGWNLAIVEYFSMENVVCQYEYDFGDGWHHSITLEGILPREEGVSYPRCVAGEHACPPEDVGGVWGYEEFLKAISYKNAPEHNDMLEWCGGWFDPEWFDLDYVRFTNPSLRWRIANQGAEVPENLRMVQYHRMKTGD